MATKAATQAVMETGTSLVDVVVPGTQKFHPLHPKARAVVNASGSILESVGVASVSDDGTGQLTVTWATPFSSAHYGVEATVYSGVASNAQVPYLTAQSTAAITLQCRNVLDTLVDPTKWLIEASGDL
jgi:hypothetical protein